MCSGVFEGPKIGLTLVFLDMVLRLKKMLESYSKKQYFSGKSHPQTRVTSFHILLLLY